MWWASCSTVMAVTTLLLTLKFGAYWPVYLGTHWHFAGAERDSGVLCTSAEAWEGCCVFWIFTNKNRPPSLLAGHGAGTGSKSSKLLPGTSASRVTWLSCHPIMCLWIVSGTIVLWVLRCDFLIPLIFLHKFKSITYGDVWVAHSGWSCLTKLWATGFCKQNSDRLWTLPISKQMPYNCAVAWYLIVDAASICNITNDSLWCSVRQIPNFVCV